jgi:hypothetical protein
VRTRWIEVMVTMAAVVVTARHLLRPGWSSRPAGTQNPGALDVVRDMPAFVLCHVHQSSSPTVEATSA